MIHPRVDPGKTTVNGTEKGNEKGHASMDMVGGEGMIRGITDLKRNGIGATIRGTAVGIAATIGVALRA